MAPNTFMFLLCQSERARLFSLSMSVHRAVFLAGLGDCSSIPHSDRSLIHSDIITCAQKLGIPAECVTLHFRQYVKHQCERSARRKSTPFLCRHKVLGWYRAKQWDLAEMLNTDVQLIRAIAPNERVQDLLESGVARFRQKHACPKIKGTTGVFWSFDSHVEMVKKCQETRERRNTV